MTTPDLHMPTRPATTAPNPASNRGESRPIEAIADLARWAPSGDNTQPWRFEIAGDAHLVVHGHDTRDHCVYDLDGRPSQMSLGALIETASIAASQHDWQMRCARRPDTPETPPIFDLCFSPNARLEPDPLLYAVTKCSIQRRSFASIPLTPAQKFEQTSTAEAAARNERVD